MQEAINVVKQCYQKTSLTNDTHTFKDPSLIDCLVVDRYVANAAKKSNEDLEKQKEKPEFDQNYINGLDERLTSHLKTDEYYKKYNQEAVKAYLDRSYFLFKIYLSKTFINQENSLTYRISDLNPAAYNVSPLISIQSFYH